MDSKYYRQQVQVVAESARMFPQGTSEAAEEITEIATAITNGSAVTNSVELWESLMSRALRVVMTHDHSYQMVDYRLHQIDCYERDTFMLYDEKYLASNVHSLQIAAAHIVEGMSDANAQHVATELVDRCLIAIFALTSGKLCGVCA